MSDQLYRSLKVKNRDTDKKSNSGMLVSTLIKYAAYVFIFFGFLYFLANFVFPKF